MSNQNKFLSDYVYLAEASYANFSKGYDTDNVIKAISGTKDEGGVEKPENFAKLVTDNYSVKAHYTDREGDGESSFSGTLFQNKDSGDYVISMRGTQELATDLVAVDGGDIVFDGSAHRQIVDMYNFWMQIKNPQGEAYRVATMEVVEDLTAQLKVLQDSQAIIVGVIDDVITSKIETLYQEAQNLGYIVDKGRGEILSIDFAMSNEIYSDEREYGLGIDANTVTVSGHSLGGHLTAAFSRLFPEVTEHAYMVNGAGFGRDTSTIPLILGLDSVKNFNNVFAALNPNPTYFDSDKLSNIIGDKNIDLVANDWPIGLAQPSSSVPRLFIEQPEITSSILGHGSDQMSDSMAVMDLFIKLDNSLAAIPTNELIEMLNDILESSEINEANTLETIIEKLVYLLDPANPITIIEGDRNSLYEGILKVHELIKVGGKFIDLPYTLTSIDDALIDNASNGDDLGLAIRYALFNLNPFVLQGFDYVDHNKNGELELLSEEFPNGMTAQYIKDRAMLLQGLMEGGIENTDRIVAYELGNKDNWVFDYIKNENDNNNEDGITKEQRFFYGLERDNRHYVKFGGIDDEVIEGTYKDDHLFGGEGDDTIEAGVGDDYLEGNQGNDTLIGGDGDDTLLGSSGNDILYGDSENENDGKFGFFETKGNDILIGGSGDDTLKGGRGNDTLNGGEDFDTYQIYDETINYGFDTIIDSDGKGVIKFGDKVVEAGKKISDNLYQSLDGSFLISVIDDLATDTSNLRIWEKENSGGAVTVEDWKDGDLGIVLAATDETLITSNIVDMSNSDTFKNYSFNESNYIHSSVIIYGDGETSTLSLSKNTVGDYINLEGQEIEYRVYGGNKGDVIITGEKRDIIWVDKAQTWKQPDKWHETTPIGDNIVDYVYTPDPSEHVITSPLDEGGDIHVDIINTVQSGGGQDTIYGGFGTELVKSGSENDTVYGGGNSDEIFGGDGNDLIHGDGIVVKQFLPEFWRDGYYPFYLRNRIEDGAQAYRKANSELDMNLIEDHSSHYSGSYNGSTGKVPVSKIAELASMATNLDHHSNDMLLGGKGYDILIGEGGADTIYGGDDSDLIMGDNIYIHKEMQSLANTRLVPGSWGGAGVSTETSTGSSDFGGQSPEDILFPWVDYSAIANSNETNELFSTWIAEFSGADNLYGGKGNDLIFGGSKSDYIEGNEGNDTIYADSDADTMHIEKHKWNNQIDSRIIETFGDLETGFIYNYDYQHFNDSKPLANSMAISGEDKVYGGTGDDIIYGEGNGDYLYGEQGNDTIHGDADFYLHDSKDRPKHGNDFISGGAGADFIYGGGMNDTIDGGTENDTIHGDYDESVLNGQFHGNDTIDAGDGADKVWGDGGNDVIYGGIGDDIIFGDNDFLSDQYHGNDTLHGGLGNDTLHAGAGDDNVYGDEGDDILVAGKGYDILQGGQGRDTYILDSEALEDDSIKTIVDLDSNGYLIVNGENWKGKEWRLDDSQDAESQKWTDFSGNFISKTANGYLIEGDSFNAKILIKQELDENNQLLDMSIINSSNHVPEAANLIDDQWITAGKSFNISLSDQLFIDQDGDNLTYTIKSKTGGLPDWLIFDDENSTLSGIAPTHIDLTLTITATDPEGESAEQEFKVRSNAVPTVNQPVDDTLYVPSSHEDFNYPLPIGTFIDQDGDSLTYILEMADGTSLPSGLHIDPITGQINVSNLAITANQVFNLVIRATDTHGESVEQSIDLKMNSTPLLNQGFEDITLNTNTADSIFTYEMPTDNFIDKDGHTLTYLLAMADGSNVPTGLVIDPVTGNITFDSNKTSIGLDTTYNIIITVIDEYGASTSENTTLNFHINSAPIVNSPLPENIDIDILENWEYQIPSNTFDDIDDDILTYSLVMTDGSELLSEIQIDTDTGRITADTLALMRTGFTTIDLKVIATDIHGAFASEDITFQINENIITIIDPVTNGTDLDDIIVALNDNSHTIYAEDGDDTVISGGGEDVLDGGKGADTLIGGVGNDIYQIDDTGDNIIEFANEGQDTVKVGFDYTLQDNLENLILTGSAIKGNGNAADNDIRGNDQDNILDGGLGEDYLHGGKGDDTYIVNNVSDSIREEYSEGVDTVLSYTNYTISENIENLELLGDAIEGIGNKSDNRMLGNDENNTLAGKRGNDVYIGGKGNDIFMDTGGDNIVVLSKGDNNDTIARTSDEDRVYSTTEYKNGVFWTKNYYGQVSNEVVFTDVQKSDVSFSLINNDLIIKYSEADSLKIENFTKDLALTKISYSDGSFDALEDIYKQLIIETIGTEQDDNIVGHHSIKDVIHGHAGDDTIVGGQNDKLYGGNGDDTLIVRESNSSYLNGGDGHDIYDLYDIDKENHLRSNIANIEIFDKGGDGEILLDSSDIYVNWGSGPNGYAHTINLGHAYDILKETQTIDDEPSVNFFSNSNWRYDNFYYDAVKGLITYSEASYVDKSFFELDSNAKTDHYFTINDFTLFPDFNNMQITVSGIDWWIPSSIQKTTFSLKDFVGQGNVVSKYSDNADTINVLGIHKYGMDRIYAESGDDTIYLYETDVTGDVVGDNRSEYHGGQGDDTFYGKNKVRGTIYGEDGNDTIQTTGVFEKVYGGLGDDTIIMENQSNREYNYSVLHGGEGNDFISAQNANIFGDAGNDIIIALGDGATMDGGAGADTLTGSLGNDTFIVDEYDTYIEEGKDLDGGYDTIHIESDFDLSQNNFEAVTLLGSDNFNAFGDQFDNIIHGNEGNNLIDGKAGADTMLGGAGDDYYVLDQVGDSVIELLNDGMDTIESYVDIEMHKTQNIENLILKGDAKTAFGNELDNVITLNEQNNFVNGLGGNDTIVYQKGGGQDTINMSDSTLSTDTLVIQGYLVEQTSFVREQDSLMVRFVNSDEYIKILDYFRAYETDIQLNYPYSDSSVPNTTDNTSKVLPAPPNESGSLPSSELSLGDLPIPTIDNKIDRIIFDNNGEQVILTQQDIDNAIIERADNHEPTVNKHAQAIIINDDEALSVQFDADTIVDTDAWDSSLNYRITLDSQNADGSYQDIPDWLSFDADTRTLTGSPTVDSIGSYSFILWAGDLFGTSAGTYLTLTVNSSQPVDVPVETTPDNVVEGTDSSEQLLGTNGNDLINGYLGDDQIFGFAGNDTLNGGAGNDYLAGGNGSGTNSGNDIINGGAGDDTLSGEDGNDILNGGAGNDSYVYKANQGIDVIDNSGGGTDVIFFQQIDKTQLTYHKEGNDLIILVDGDLNQQVKVKDHFSGSDQAIDYIVASDGMMVSAQKIAGQLTALPESNDTGGNGDDDTTTPTTPTTPEEPADNVDLSGDNTIKDTAGSDRLEGGRGNDTYIYNAGKDTIVDTHGIDEIIFSNGITFNQVGSGLMSSGNDLILRVNGDANNQVTIKDYFSSGDSIIETISFETGGSMSHEQIFGLFGKAIPEATPIDNTTPNAPNDNAGADIIGTHGNDQLQGTDVDNRLQGLLGDDRLDGELGNDILIGGTGNDFLKGNAGNDLYYFEAGFGQDIIDNTGGGIDNIYFDGVGFNDIASGLMRSNDDLILKVSGTTDQLTIADFFEGGESAVGNISFASGGNISADQIFGAYGISNPNPTNVSSSQHQSKLGSMLDMMQQFDENSMNNGYGDVI